MKIAAGKFKAECLKLMDEVNINHEEVIITKHGKPVARLVPSNHKSKKKVFGKLSGTLTYHGDITEPVGEVWDVE